MAEFPLFGAWSGHRMNLNLEKRLNEFFCDLFCGSGMLGILNEVQPCDGDTEKGGSKDDDEGGPGGEEEDEHGEEDGDTDEEECDDNESIDDPDDEGTEDGEDGVDEEDDRMSF
ncbi:hypothetical protein EV702DRAFT_1048418 [Suillus placidus]|uniref:Uncharacterized protein n=1 Tax=Suillus placidus TaxID=48579 RepID=A0A9P6ZNF8_9AGAM|nr:hypothetical protein EV702DRAFT_1048418 [Suillus placidus]